MDALPLTGNNLHKIEMEYYGNIGHTLGRIQWIDPMGIIEIFCANCHIATKTVAPTLPGYQGIKWCVQYLASNLNKPIYYPTSSYDVSNVIKLTWSGNKI